MFVVIIGLSSKKLYSFIITFSNSSPSLTSFLIPEIISLASLLLSSSFSSLSLSSTSSSSFFFSLSISIFSFFSNLICGKFLQCKNALDDIIFFSLFSSISDNSTWHEPPYNILLTFVEHILPIKCSFSSTFSTHNFLIFCKLDKLAIFLFKDT